MLYVVRYVMLIDLSKGWFSLIRMAGEMCRADLRRTELRAKIVFGKPMLAATLT